MAIQNTVNSPNFGNRRAIGGIAPAIAIGQPISYEQFQELEERPNNTFTDVSIGSSNTVPVFNFGLFSTVIFTTVLSDDSQLYNLSTGIHTVPSDGIYLILAVIRTLDGSAPNQNFGVGVNISNGDFPGFLWHTTQSGRTSYPYNRVSKLNFNDQLRMFTYANDPNLQAQSAGMQILRIG